MKIGLGVVTCRRYPFFQQVAATIPFDRLDVVVAVNDGEEYPEYPGPFNEVFHNPDHISRGVGVSKNKVLRCLLDAGCDIMFTLEDDITIKRADVFERYVALHEVSGIHHFNFALHGPANRIGGRPCRKAFVAYEGDHTAHFYSGCIGAVSMYTADCLEDVGLMDERFVNAIEHLEHTYRICQRGWHPPYWWFADIANSGDYLEEIEFSNESSIIRRDAGKFMATVKKAAEQFEAMYGCLPQRLPVTNIVQFQQWIRSNRKDT